MNLLGIDYGSRQIGLAVSVKGVISPLSTIANNPRCLDAIGRFIHQYQIQKIVIGLCPGPLACQIQRFCRLLSRFNLPLATVEEAVSTVEASQIFKRNQKKSKQYQSQIDAIAAAVILQRCQV